MEKEYYSKLTHLHCCWRCKQTSSRTPYQQQFWL